jgi:hypothetical protein
VCAIRVSSSIFFCCSLVLSFNTIYFRYRFCDKATKRHYYANVKLKLSSWTRPELDQWFLEESIMMLFQPREISALKALFVEEMAHFQCVSVEQFMDVLREVGERCSKTWITQLFRGYASSDKQLKTWKQFMEVVSHIKRYRTSSVVAVQNPFQKLATCFSQSRLKSMLRPRNEKFGDWCAIVENVIAKI